MIVSQLPCVYLDHVLYPFITPNSAIHSHIIASNGNFILYLQWMVLNYNMFTPGQPVVPETLWVLEQMPGIVQMGDLSLYLINNSYWASYNIPYVIFYCFSSYFWRERLRMI